MARALARIASDEGASAVEYAILASLIAAVIGAAVLIIGQITQGMLTLSF